MYYLQQTNTKTKITKTLPIEVIDDNTDDTSVNQDEPSDKPVIEMTQEI
jgi:hypothetical protein